MSAKQAGRLYVVATPIGNLEDVSARALRVLGEVDLVAAEDTRVTRRLLQRYGIRAKLASYHERNEREMARRLLARLERGESIALVADAGTPAISDPGYRLVAEASRAGIEVVAVPGPSALVALLSISGLPTDRFVFEGFLPGAKGARERRLSRLAGVGATVVFYESPRRVVRLLGELASFFADPPVAVGRELTKLHEEVLRGPASEVQSELASRERLRGEFVVAAYIAAAEQVLSRDAIEREVAQRLAQGLTVREIARLLRARGVSRREVYAAARRLREESP